MKRPIKYGILTVVLAILIAGVWFARIFVAAMNAFFQEDAITHDVLRVVDAVTAYEEATDSAPDELADLLPDYLNAVPDPGSLGQIEYELDTDTRVWVIRLHSSAFREPRVFLYRSDGTLTDEEQARSQGSIHGVEVLTARDRE